MEQCWPPSVEQLTNFVAYLSLENLSHKTAKLYLCAIAFQSKLSGGQDTTKHYIVVRAVEGMRRVGGVGRARLPITLSLLDSICTRIPAVCGSTYECVLFSAAYCLAFFGFFRVGELTVTKQEYMHKVLAISDVWIDIKSGVLLLHLRYSKTDQNGKGVHLRIQKTGSNVCPVNNMFNYLAIRPKIQGPLFCHFSGKPLTRYQFSAILNKVLVLCNVNYKQYKSHSFRIGAATAAAKMGHSVDKIKAAGRWSSEAYRTYVRDGAGSTNMPNLVSPS